MAAVFDGIEVLPISIDEKNKNTDVLHKDVDVPHKSIDSKNKGVEGLHKSVAVKNHFLAAAQPLNDLLFKATAAFLKNLAR